MKTGWIVAIIAAFAAFLLLFKSSVISTPLTRQNAITAANIQSSAALASVGIASASGVINQVSHLFSGSGGIATDTSSQALNSSSASSWLGQTSPTPAPSGFLDTGPTGVDNGLSYDPTDESYL